VNTRVVQGNRCVNMQASAVINCNIEHDGRNSTYVRLSSGHRFEKMMCHFLNGNPAESDHLHLELGIHKRCK